MPEPGLERTYHELNRGVDPAVAADIGLEVPEQYLPPEAAPASPKDDFQEYKDRKAELYPEGTRPAAPASQTSIGPTVGYLASRGQFGK